MRKKLIVSSICLTLANLAFAGGGTTFPETKAVVCKSQDIEVITHVLADKPLNIPLQNLPYGAAVVKIYDQDLISQMKLLNLIDISEWDQTAFLRSIGVDPASVRENITLLVTGQSEDKFVSNSVLGGTLHLSYRSKLSVLSNLVPNSKSIHPARHQYLNAQLTRSKTGQLRIDFTLVESATQKCVKEGLVAHGYLVNSDGSPVLVPGCVQFEDVAPVKLTSLLSKSVRLDSCGLLK